MSKDFIIFNTKFDILYITEILNIERRCAFKRIPTNIFYALHNKSQAFGGLLSSKVQQKINRQLLFMIRYQYNATILLNLMTLSKSL